MKNIVVTKKVFKDFDNKTIKQSIKEVKNIDFTKQTKDNKLKTGLLYKIIHEAIIIF